MLKNRRTGVLAVAASLALAAGAVTVVVPASAGETVKIEGGTLTFDGATNRISYAGDEYSGSDQDLTTTTLLPAVGAANCDLNAPAEGPLLALTGYLGVPSPSSTLRVGYKGGSLGVNEETDSLCSRVDAISRTNKTEYLDVALSDKLINYGGNRLLAKSASLDIEVKQAGLFNSTKAKVEATALLGGVAKGTFNLIQGSGNSTPTTFYCPVGDTKNCQWNIAAPVDADGKPLYYFDTLRLKAVSAGFSLEGGSDATQTTNPDANAKKTTFALVSEVDQVVACDADGNPVNGTITDTNASVTYLGDTTGGCSGFGVTLESDPTSLRFLKPPATVDAQFVVAANWQPGRPVEPLTPAVPAVPAPKVDFELGGGEKDMTFCPEYLFDSAGVLVGTTNPADNEQLALLDMDAADGTQFACVGSRSVDVTEADFTVNDTIYLVGDVKMRLP